MSASTELRFPRDLYAGEAVDEALRAFAHLVDAEREAEGDAWVVRLSTRYAAHRRRIVGELANYALARTIERGGAA